MLLFNNYLNIPFMSVFFSIINFKNFVCKKKKGQSWANVAAIITLKKGGGVDKVGVNLGIISISASRETYKI